jgi:hypothetical protein
MIKIKNTILKWSLVSVLIFSFCFILFMGGCYGLAKLVYISKGCKQLHIDNTEMHTGIDIPAKKEIDCNYSESQRLKRTYFVIDKTEVKMPRYIVFSEFKPLLNSAVLSTNDFFRLTQDTLYKLIKRNTLFYKEHCKASGEYYKALLDTTSGQVWVNLKYVD